MALKIKLKKTPQFDSSKVIKSILQNYSKPLTILKSVKKKRVALEALTSGLPVKEAYNLAGLSQGQLSGEKLRSSPTAQIMLKEILDKTYIPVKIAEKMAQLWDAQSVILDRQGNKHVVSDNFTQDKALGRVLKMLKHVETEDGDLGKVVPMRVVFNVTSEAPKPVVDVTEVEEIE